ncbi:cysteine-rich venom protein-like [Babylonia areolata]|uniref:cysteine-rich venom protein-like n=1 Tax=Babylonia areolata TaxID=304850 RepID=UPI003FD4A5BB
MRTSRLSFVIAITIGLASCLRIKRDYCPPQYSLDHTLCRDNVGQVLPLTSQERATIVQEHNLLRAAVAPPAADMTKMSYPGKLPGVWIGQNLAAGSKGKVMDAFRFWAIEKSDFRYGQDHTTVIGHYTQETILNVSNCTCQAR